MKIIARIAALVVIAMLVSLGCLFLYNYTWRQYQNYEAEKNCNEKKGKWNAEMNRCQMPAPVSQSAPILPNPNQEVVVCDLKILVIHKLLEVSPTSFDCGASPANAPDDQVRQCFQDHLKHKTPVRAVFSYAGQDSIVTHGYWVDEAGITSEFEADSWGAFYAPCEQYLRFYKCNRVHEYEDRGGKVLVCEHSLPVQ